MNICTLRTIFYIFLFLINFSQYITTAKEIKIRNDEDNFYNLGKIINSNQNANELILNFVDRYYDFNKINELKIESTLLMNITFSGHKDGTIFDYHYNYKGIFSFSSVGKKGITFTIENIIIQNYYTPKSVNNIPVIFFESDNYNFYFFGKNCTFQNNISKIFKIQATPNNQIQTNPQ
ncbi:hypothetical protein PIROE2DRAFT_13299, partial [Piromyces sp. E2]